MTCFMMIASTVSDFQKSLSRNFLVVSVQGKYLDYLIPKLEISGADLGGQA
jgi:hypothetical protein